MRNPILFPLAFLATLLLGGCISPKGYIDPAGRTVKYSDVSSLETPRKADIVSRFTTNGKENKRATKVLEQKLTRILESTKIIDPTIDADLKIEFHLDNHGDTGEAVGKGFATGFTFGLVGSTVTDYYTLTVRVKGDAGEAKDFKYDHALHTTIGVTSAPAGMVPVDYADAFDQIIEDLVLRFLKEYSSRPL